MAIPNPCRVAVLATHPVHYQVQLFRRLSQIPELDVTLLFCSRLGLSRQIDPTFGIEVQWYDESILDGCKYKFLENPLWERGPTSVYATISPSVFKEVTSNSYDVLLVQGYAGITEWFAIAAAIKKSCSVLFRGDTAINTHASIGRKIMRWIIMQALSKSVDSFLAIGTRSKEFFLHYGIKPERIVLSPYAVDNDFFFSKAEQLNSRKREIRECLGIPRDVPVVLYISKMIPRKRPLDLLRAFEQLDVDAFLLFVGDGPLKPHIVNHVGKKNMKNVLCVGFKTQEEICKFYAIADVFVLPSEYDIWGVVVNEAMCFSLPIITTNEVLSSADLVANKGNGFLYKAGNVEMLHAALQNLVRHRELRLEMGRQSRMIIQGWDQNASVNGICQGISMALRH